MQQWGVLPYGDGFETVLRPELLIERGDVVLQLEFHLALVKRIVHEEQRHREVRSVAVLAAALSVGGD